MVKGFTVLRQEELPEYNGKGTFIRHDRTGLKVFYFKPESNNENYFSFNFKTPVEDDSGIAHCLEHMVLQGSEKYPVKNAYFHLNQKSLTRKLNAVTSQYRTSYYAESYVPEDYFRLLDFYGDSVFFPKLDENSFKQEVWRFDLDQNNKPFINGVVFNEMSALPKISSYTYDKLCKKQMYKGSESAFISGGDFNEIPNLSCSALREFHKKYYTPANCLLFLFGKMDLDEQLTFLEEKLLNRLPEGTLETQIKDQILPLDSMTEIKIEVPYKGLEQSTVELNILCKSVSTEEIEERDFIVARIASLVKKQLKFSEVGKFYTFIIGSPHHRYFIFGFGNVKNTEIEKAKEILLDSLKHSLDAGMDYEELNAACKNLDLDFNNPKQITKLEFKIRGGWINNDNPFSLIFNKKEEWNSLKEKLLSYDDKVFKAKLNEYLLENPNKSFVIKTPDKDYFDKIQTAREIMLQTKLKEKTIEEISKEKDAFEKYLNQDDSELVNKLFPSIDIESIKTFDDFGVDNVEQIEGKEGPLLLFSSAQKTDGKIKFRISFAIDNLSVEELEQLAWLGVYNNCYGFNGMKTIDADNFAKGKGLKILGLGKDNYGSYSAGEQIYENRYWYEFTFSCYHENFEECLKIFSDYLYNKNFSDEEEQESAKRELTKSFARINQKNAELFAVMHLNSYFSKKGKFENDITGINKLAIKEKNTKADINSIIGFYQKLYEKIVHGSAIVNVYCEENYLDKAKKEIKEWLKNIDIKPLKENQLIALNEKIPETEKKVSTILSQTNSGSLILAFTASDYLTKEYVAEHALLSWFNKHILYEKLRNQHGAYSCSSMIIPYDNLLFITTSRDPDPSKSLNIVEECLEKLNVLDNELTEDCVNEIIQKEFASNLSDINPDNKGLISFFNTLRGIPEGERKICMKHTLELDRNDLIAAGKRIYENSKKYKACIVSGSDDQVLGDVICDMRKL